MTKGYVIADIHVRDKDGFEKFREMAKSVLEEYGAKVLVRTPEKACDTDLIIAEGA